ncbi:MAG: hypothetical protein EPO00_10730 [Chloroflexota bacterium]|nr:MAG: hypothetical protein EPO00_10730 [Chloroflexota bacterium]
MSDGATFLMSVSIAGIGGGLWLLFRGFGGYRRAGRVADTGTSRIATLAVGEVRVTGTVEPAELALTSPLQSRRCVYFRSRVRQQQGRSTRTVLDEEHAVGFRVRDDSGAIRVFPRGANWDVPPVFKEGDGFSGDLPPGLDLRSGSAIGPGTIDRDHLIEQLLTVRPPFGGSDPGAMGGSRAGIITGSGHGRTEYEEARIEVGDVVTIVGTALPFDPLPDPDGADLADGSALGGPLSATSDPEIAADLDAARAAGTLAANPEEAWGNASIPGFGIGEPVQAPHLDPEATPASVADHETAERFTRTFEIGPGELVIAIGQGRPMLVSLGSPSVAVARGQDQFLVGLLGAVLAIGSAVVLALAISGTIGP